MLNHKCICTTEEGRKILQHFVDTHPQIIIPINRQKAYEKQNEAYIKIYNNKRIIMDKRCIIIKE
jgi:hypothetical protein